MKRPIVPWDGRRELATVIAPDRVVLSAEGAALLASALDHVERTTGGRLTLRMRHVRDVLRHVESHARPGHADVRQAADRPESPVELITTEEAATMLHLSTRQVRRLINAGDLGPSRRRGRGHAVARAEVVALAGSRPATHAQEIDESEE